MEKQTVLAKRTMGRQLSNTTKRTEDGNKPNAGKPPPPRSKRTRRRRTGQKQSEVTAKKPTNLRRRCPHCALEMDRRNYAKVSGCAGGGGLS